MALNEILLTVTLIVQLKSSGIIGSASGFFYAQSDRLYLVTNKHVVRGEKTGPDALRLRLHTDANDVLKNTDYDVPLFKGGIPVWREHATAKEADVAVVPLDLAEIQKRFIVKAWAKDRLFPKDLRLDPGEDVFVMGYPLSFHDVKHNLPIFRNAMVASTYRVPFQGAPLFLTDANLHPGTSGSPVITKPKSAWVDDKAIPGSSLGRFTTCSVCIQALSTPRLPAALPWVSAPPGTPNSSTRSLPNRSLVQDSVASNFGIQPTALRAAADTGRSTERSGCYSEMRRQPE